MNSKLNVLRGEESKRVFDFRVVITNPNAVSQIETTKKELLNKLVQELIERGAESEEQFNQELEKINYYVNYEWQDLRELRGNALLNHYYKEYDIPTLFNAGFMDAAAVAEEIYQCDIVGGEPTIERLNPLKIRIFKSGYSNKVEDADMIVLEDYWSPGKIIDTYYDVLTQKDVEYIESIANNAGKASADSMDNIDDRAGFIPNPYIQGEDGEFSAEDLFPSEAEESSLLPYDVAGNVRVIKVFWKSRRKIKKVKSFDPETGEETINFYPETYVPNTDAGEEEFEEAFENSQQSKVKTLIIGDDLVNHERVENIIQLITLIKKYSNFNLVVLNEELSQKIDSCKNFDLEELEELKSFNGTLVYKLIDENNDELIASQTFANVAKVSNGNEVYVISKNEKVKRVLKIDENLHGTIAILKTKINEDIFNGYGYKQVKIEKVEA